MTDFGGAEKVVLSLINNINPGQYELVPIVFTAPGMINNIFLQRLKACEKQCHIIPVNKYKLKYINPLANMIEAYRLFKKHKFDLVHTHGYRADVLGITLSKLTGTPVISTCHGFISTDAHLRFYNRLDRFILRYADRITAVSDEMKKNLMRNGIKESRIAMIQNAVEKNSNEELFVQNRQKKRKLLDIQETGIAVGYIGRLSEEKGVKYLLEAHRLLIESAVPAKLLIIGEGPQRKDLEDSVRKAGIEGSVIFAGFKNDIENWLPAMDVFVLPSLTEGTPMSLLEAMALGIPVIASAVGGVPQVINPEKNGILVQPEKPEEIKNAIQVLSRNKTLRNSISKGAQETMESKYDLKKWINKIETEYRQTVNPS